jgi:hypothetical protein
VNGYSVIPPQKKKRKMQYKREDDDIDHGILGRFP